MNRAGSEIASGWYDDPDGSAQMRYWDGERWTDHRSPNPPDRRKPRLGCVGTVVLALGAGFVALVVVVGVFVVVVFYLPYRDAGSKLRHEADRLEIRAGTRVGETYAGGVCLDNCPRLSRCYVIGTDQGPAVLERIAKTLASHGYRTEVLRSGPDGQREATYVRGERGEYRAVAQIGRAPATDSSCTRDAAAGSDRLLFAFYLNP